MAANSSFDTNWELIVFLSFASLFSGLSVWMAICENPNLEDFISFALCWTFGSLGTAGIWIGISGRLRGRRMVEMKAKQGKEGWARRGKAAAAVLWKRLQTIPKIIRSARSILNSLFSRKATSTSPDLLVKSALEQISTANTAKKPAEEQKEKSDPNKRDFDSNIFFPSNIYASTSSETLPPIKASPQLVLETYNARWTSLLPHERNWPYPTPTLKSAGFHNCRSNRGGKKRPDLATESLLISLNTQLFFIRGYGLACEFKLQDFSSKLILLAGNRKEKVSELIEFLKTRELRRWSEDSLEERSGRDGARLNGLGRLPGIVAVRKGVEELIGRCDEFLEGYSGGFWKGRGRLIGVERGFEHNLPTLELADEKFRLFL